MRGARHHNPEQSVYPGIIPADAGSTLDISRFLRSWWDHPRGCGEHDFTGDLVDDSAGSSPRMRGAHIGAGTVASTGGIIPADAGSTESG